MLGGIIEGQEAYTLSCSQAFCFHHTEVLMSSDILIVDAILFISFSAPCTKDLIISILTTPQDINCYT